MTLALAYVLSNPVLPQGIPGSVVMEEIPEFMSTPAEGYTWLVPVLIIRYLPTTDGIWLDSTKCPDYWVVGHKKLTDMLRDIQNSDRNNKINAEDGSKFRGYKDPEASPSLGIQVVGIINVYDHTPPGRTGTENGVTYFFPDYISIFNRLDVKHYIDDLGVKEVWLWQNEFNGSHPSYRSAIHKPQDFRGLQESNMSSSLTGDISNSHRFDDLPIYSHTFTVYSCNIWRATDATLIGHIRGHQIEAILTFASTKQDGGSGLFWRDFVGRTIAGQGPLGRAGDCHHPPNTRIDYDYFNMTLVSSDIEDWKPAGGAQKMVNARTWDKGWLTYWFQNMPGKDNSIPHTRTGMQMTNWWAFSGDWDNSIRNNLGLYEKQTIHTIATLNAIKVNEVSIANFHPDTLTYNIILPHNTLAIPFVKAIRTDGKSKMVISQAPAIAGTATITVTAEDLTTIRTYTINFTVDPYNDDAFLRDLRVNGQHLMEFMPGITGYTMELPHHTPANPVVSVTTRDPKATFAITQAQSLPGFATVVVTSEDGKVVKTYSINFRLAPDTDATLSELSIDNVPLASFQRETTQYTFVLRDEVTLPPLVTATTFDPNAFATVFQASSIPGSASVEVTAEDFSTSMTYEILFRHSLAGLEMVTLNGALNLFPNPTDGKFNISFAGVKPFQEPVEIIIADCLGRKVYSSGLVPDGYRAELSVDLLNCPPGVYLVQIRTANKLAFRKLVIN